MDLKELEGKSLMELRELARSLGIKSITKYRKQQLRDIIEEESKRVGIKEETKEEAKEEKRLRRKKQERIIMRC